MVDLFENPVHHRDVAERDALREQPAPPSRAAFRKSIRRPWAAPFLYIDWLAKWGVYWLRKLSLLELLETCSSFTLLIGVIFYFAEAPERTKSKHYQAWQVINTAQGKGGSGGRTDALHELNEDGVPLVGVDVSDAFLQNIRLEHADLRRSNFHAADLKSADLKDANLEQSDFIFANLRGATLTGVNFSDAKFADADLTGAALIKARFSNASFDRADLRDSDIANATDWKTMSVKLANIHAIHNAPPGFVDWAISQGAVDIASDAEWSADISKASDKTKR